jgi:hemerythrin-like domain-containing protein
MKPTEELKAEHRVIERMLDVLLAAAAKLEAGEAVPPEHLNQSVDFIRTFADRCHHGKEEDLLFTAMEEAGFPKETGPIAVMLAEHDQGRAFVREMAAAAEAYADGDADAGRTFARNASGYAALLADHIAKEDNILYEMADQRLPAEKQRELAAAFERVERERIGPGQHEAYHRLVDELSREYGVGE